MDWEDENIDEEIIDEKEDESFFDDEGFAQFEDGEVEYDKNYDGIDDAVEDINFSAVVGKNSFKRAFPKVKSKVKKVSTKKKIIQKRIPLNSYGKNTTVKHKAFIDEKGRKRIQKILVPRNQQTIVEHVGKFIIDDDYNDYKNINYHEGHKLKQILLTINNDSAIDFNFELFNPSLITEYFYATGLNLNDKIQVAGANNVLYSDLVYNILANPLYVYNCELIFSGSSEQKSQSFIIKNKNSQGELKIAPISIPLYIDNYQIEKNNISIYNFKKVINRPYIADGMDVIQYKVLAGNTVTMCFYSRQMLLKKQWYKDAKTNKELI